MLTHIAFYVNLKFILKDSHQLTITETFIEQDKNEQGITDKVKQFSQRGCGSTKGTKHGPYHVATW